MVVYKGTLLHRTAKRNAFLGWPYTQNTRLFIDDLDDDDFYYAVYDNDKNVVVWDGGIEVLLVSSKSFMRKRRNIWI